MEGCTDPVSVKVGLKKGFEKAFLVPKEKLGCFESLFFEDIQNVSVGLGLKLSRSSRNSVMLFQSEGFQFT